MLGKKCIQIAALILKLTLIKNKSMFLKSENWLAATCKIDTRLMFSELFYYQLNTMKLDMETDLKLPLNVEAYTSQSSSLRRRRNTLGTFIL